MALRLFDGNIKETTTVNYWLDNESKYWPTRDAIKSAEIKTKAELKRGKGNRFTVEAKLKAIQQLLKK